jgi:hypothetical protein
MWDTVQSQINNHVTMFLVKPKFLDFSIQLPSGSVEDITTYLNYKFILKDGMTILNLECYVQQMPAKARATSNYTHDNDLQKFLFAEDLVYTKSSLYSGITSMPQLLFFSVELDSIHWSKTRWN